MNLLLLLLGNVLVAQRLINQMRVLGSITRARFLLQGLLLHVVKHDAIRVVVFNVVPTSTLS